jgi:hypothetical protein
MYKRTNHKVKCNRFISSKGEKYMKYRIVLLGALIFSMIIVAACNSILTTPIQKILINPRDYADKNVTIVGTVVETFSIVVIKYFTLRDETGEIAVITDKPLPAKGQKIKVSGTVQEAFSLGDKQLIVLIEGSENENN